MPPLAGVIVENFDMFTFALNRMESVDKKMRTEF